MTDPKPRRGRPPKEPDEPVKIPLDFETALRGLMATGEHADEETEAAMQRARADERDADDRPA